MSIPLARGRLFTERDGDNTPQVAMVSRSLARIHLHDVDPSANACSFNGDARHLTKSPVS